MSTYLLHGIVQFPSRVIHEWHFGKWRRDYLGLLSGAILGCDKQHRKGRHIVIDMLKYRYTICEYTRIVNW